MLNIYIQGFLNPPANLSEILDAEEGFTRIIDGIADTTVNRALIATIDKGTYLDSQNFIDRFGNKQPLAYVSTGCKAALCVTSLADCVILMSECGRNAINAILQLCTSGNIILPFDYSGIATLDTSKKDIHVGNYKFTSLQRLQYYLLNEFPDEPDLSIGGISCLK